MSQDVSRRSLLGALTASLLSLCFGKRALAAAGPARLLPPAASALSSSATSGVGEVCSGAVTFRATSISSGVILFDPAPGLIANANL